MESSDAFALARGRLPGVASEGETDEVSSEKPQDGAEGPGEVEPDRERDRTRDNGAKPETAGLVRGLNGVTVEAGEPTGTGGLPPDSPNRNCSPYLEPLPPPCRCQGAFP